MATIKVFENKETLAQAAAERFAALAKDAIAERGRFTVALSGGSTPILMYRLLLRMPVDWDHIDVFWSDDRFVPPSDPESNQGAAERELLSRVRAHSVHGIYRDGTPAESAIEYERTIRETLGEPPVFDLILLGMGPDGHTASMFPGDPSVNESERLVVASHAPVGVPDRITFTLPLIASARNVAMLITGGDKAEAWSQVLRGQDLPAGRVLRLNAEVLTSIDEHADSISQKDL